MEYREPSRIAASERRTDGLGDDADAPSRARRFEFVRPAGRLDVRRLVVAFSLLTILAVVAFYLGRRALDASLGWLHRQPRYQLPFDQIELATPPPDFFRGGATRFLERVRTSAVRPEELESLPLLDVQPDRIENVFKLFPWVEKVESVAFPPRKIVVRLEYKHPAAVVRTASGEQVLVDGRGRVLPIEDVDPERLGRPIQITGAGVVAPPSTQVGLVWKTETTDHPERAEIDRHIIQAARLAGFLSEPDRKREAESTSALRMLVIAATDPYNRGLFVQNADNAMILWGEAPGEEKAGDPSADEKWKILAARARNNTLAAQGKRGFWLFTRDDMRYVPTVER